MKVRIQPAGATEVDIAGFRSVDQVVAVGVPAAVTPRRTSPPRHRARPHSRRVAADGMVEVTLVRSSRNRLGGGARARPAPVP